MRWWSNSAAISLVRPPGPPLSRMAAAVIDVLRRFLPTFLRGKPALGEAQRRAVWAITHCRTPVMGGQSKSPLRYDFAAPFIVRLIYAVAF